MARYLKQDSELGYIEDTAEIQYQKFNNLRHSIIGFMMGDFDNEGNYVISPEIKRELISMQKYIVESLDNIEICQSELKLNKNLSFMVTFDGNRATLSLIEKVNYEANFKLNSGSYSNINEYLLDQVETSGAINRNVIYQRWNIKEFGANQIDVFSCDEAALEKYFGIVNRFKYLLEANTKLLDKEEEIEEIEAAYSNKMLEILKAYPELNQVVMTQLREALTEKQQFVCVDEPNFAKTINEIIDNAIENNIDLLSADKKESFKAERRNLIVETNIKKQEVLEIAEEIQGLNAADANYNKTHGTETENSTKLVTLKTDDKEQAKTINELATTFATKSKVVEQKLREEAINRELEGEKRRLAVTVDEAVVKPETTVNTERGKLVENIVTIAPETKIVTTPTAAIVQKRREEFANSVTSKRGEASTGAEVVPSITPQKGSSGSGSTVTWGKTVKVTGMDFSKYVPKGGKGVKGGGSNATGKTTTGEKGKGSSTTTLIGKYVFVPRKGMEDEKHKEEVKTGNEGDTFSCKRMSMAEMNALEAKTVKPEVIHVERTDDVFDK